MRATVLTDNARLLATVRVNDRVTIRTPQGQERVGRAVMRGPAGWVLNLGGPHGTPGLATERNIVSVRPTKRSRDANVWGL